MTFPLYLHWQAKKHIPSDESSVPEWVFDIVMCFGTFDIFHPWHEFYLSYAQKLAKNMIVVVARDSRVMKNKKNAPLYDELSRQRTVAEHFPEAQVILGDEDDIFAPIRHEHPDVLAFGYDQYAPESEIKALFPEMILVRVPSFEPHKWKSSLLREKKNSQ